MKRILTIAAFAALTFVTTGGNAALAGTTSLSPEDAVMCTYLELAYESSCEKLEAVQAARRAAAMPSLVDTSKATVSIGGAGGAGDAPPFEPTTVPVRR